MALGNLRQGGDAASIALDGDDMARPARDQRAREPAGAGTDFDDGDARERAGGAGNAGGEVEVEKKILPERLAGDEAVAADHVAQGRQVIERCRHRAATALRAAGAVSRDARRSAATRLEGSACPVPAMSKAVPWSGDVRTI